MSKRDWVRNVALIGLTVLIGGLNLWAVVDLNRQQQDTTKRIERESAEDEKQRQYAVANCPPFPPIDSVVCVLNAQATEREARQSHEDLQAQQQSARAAYWMIFLISGQTVLSIVGLLFVLQSLRASRQAHRNEQRPWVKAAIRIDEYGIDFKKDGVIVDGSQPSPYGVGKLNVALTNVGVSPAIGVSVKCEIVDVAGESDRLAVVSRAAKRILKAYEAGEREGEALFPNDPLDIPSQYVIEAGTIANPTKEVRGRRGIIPVLLVSVCYGHAIDNSVFQTQRAYSFMFRGRGMPDERETHVLYLDNLQNIPRANIALPREPGASRAT